MFYSRVFPDRIVATENCQFPLKFVRNRHANSVAINNSVSVNNDVVYKFRFFSPTFPLNDKGRVFGPKGGSQKTSLRPVVTTGGSNE